MRLVRIPAILALVAACGGESNDGTDSVQAATDTGTVSTELNPAGPIAAVPAADAGSTMDAMDYEITDENFAKFVKASESLAFLRARDPEIRVLLDQPGTDSTNASVLERLDRHPQVSTALAQAGMSVRDYYVMAIALTSAQRHAANPAGAPPTPVGRKNAEWAQRNASQLKKLQTWGTAVAR